MANNDGSPGARAVRADIARLLDDLTMALKAAGQWQLLPPPPAALASPLPFCCDTLRFTEWVQWLFIPRTRALLAADAPLPAVSGIAPMAEEALRGCDWDTVDVIALLRRFDRLIAAAWA
ncbi:YqcC family protein [uncultured Thiohalocapsa sp.]|uniref:YqcC family protein n=1 Tax=uncultured Thiohalocapsa sp. TaxID=768990 RepID=UPI0025F522F5|nr:YqcC family protein [uncultured Thiohalocapsa sp.]